MVMTTHTERDCPRQMHRNCYVNSIIHQTQYPTIVHKDRTDEKPPPRTTNINIELSDTYRGCMPIFTHRQIEKYLCLFACRFVSIRRQVTLWNGRQKKRVLNKSTEFKRVTARGHVFWGVKHCEINCMCQYAIDTVKSILIETVRLQCAKGEYGPIWIYGIVKSATILFNCRRVGDIALHLMLANVLL